MRSRYVRYALLTVLLLGCVVTTTAGSTSAAQSTRCLGLMSSCNQCNANLEAQGLRLDETCVSCSIYEQDCKGK